MPNKFFGDDFTTEVRDFHVFSIVILPSWFFSVMKYEVVTRNQNAKLQEAPSESMELRLPSANEPKRRFIPSKW
jgi:hypothetical protein